MVAARLRRDLNSRSAPPEAVAAGGDVVAVADAFGAGVLSGAGAGAGAVVTGGVTVVLAGASVVRGELAASMCPPPGPPVVPPAVSAATPTARTATTPSAPAPCIMCRRRPS